MPTPVSPDLVSPSATVFTAPWCEALTKSEPEIIVAPVDEPISALVSLLDTDIAITGVSAVSPAAPPSAMVLISLRDEAVRLMSSAPVIFAPLAIMALVSVSPILSAKEAPTPLSPLSCNAVASAVFEILLSALMIGSRPLERDTFAPGRSSATTLLIPTLIASAPATLSLLADAPDIASTPKLLPSALRALILSVFAWIFPDPPNWARVSTSAIPMATAIPTPVASSLVFDPSAFEIMTLSDTATISRLPSVTIEPDVAINALVSGR